MAKMWAGRFSKEVDETVNAFNSSISFDGRMYRQDIQGSIAHAEMLGRCGIISVEDSKQIQAGLKEILCDIEEGKLELDMTAEDIHMFVEAELTKRYGDVGKRLHTSRSRNDQVALDIRLYLREEIVEIKKFVVELIKTLCDIASENLDTVMPGYTHLQRAQPITFAHHMMAYAQMLLRDLARLSDTSDRMNFNPLGSCALAGTTYPIDRQLTSQLLGFEGPVVNSLDGVSDRDFCVELACALSLLMTHLSRFSEEIIMWCSWEFKFIELDDAFSTGSSIMPQKKNPDIAELLRGRCGRVYGDLMGMLTVMKGTPLTYNKDFQEDKEYLFDAVDTWKASVVIFTKMLEKTEYRMDKISAQLENGFLNATDVAENLVMAGIPFRQAHHITGRLVKLCENNGCRLEDLTDEQIKTVNPDISRATLGDISIKSCVENRSTFGGTAPVEVQRQIENGTAWLENISKEWS